MTIHLELERAMSIRRLRKGRRYCIAHTENPSYIVQYLGGSIAIALNNQMGGTHKGDLCGLLGLGA